MFTRPAPAFCWTLLLHVTVSITAGVVFIGQGTVYDHLAFQRGTVVAVLLGSLIATLAIYLLIARRVAVALSMLAALVLAGALESAVLLAYLVGSDS